MSATSAFTALSAFHRGGVGDVGIAGDAGAF
jgi:hypothetical protein